MGIDIYQGLILLMEPDKVCSLPQVPGGSRYVFQLHDSLNTESREGLSLLVSGRVYPGAFHQNLLAEQ